MSDQDEDPKKRGPKPKVKVGDLPSFGACGAVLGAAPRSAAPSSWLARSPIQPLQSLEHLEVLLAPDLVWSQFSCPRRLRHMIHSSSVESDQSQAPADCSSARARSSHTRSFRNV